MLDLSKERTIMVSTTQIYLQTPIFNISIWDIYLLAKSNFFFGSKWCEQQQTQNASLLSPMTKYCLRQPWLSFPCSNQALFTQHDTMLLIKRKNWVVAIASIFSNIWKFPPSQFSLPKHEYKNNFIWEINICSFEQYLRFNFWQAIFVELSNHEWIIKGLLVFWKYCNIDGNNSILWECSTVNNIAAFVEYNTL